MIFFGFRGLWLAKQVGERSFMEISPTSRDMHAWEGYFLMATCMYNTIDPNRNRLASLGPFVLLRSSTQQHYQPTHYYGIADTKHTYRSFVMAQVEGYCSLWEASAGEERYPWLDLWKKQTGHFRPWEIMLDPPMYYGTDKEIGAILLEPPPNPTGWNMIMDRIPIQLGLDVMMMHKYVCGQGAGITTEHMDISNKKL